MDYFNAFWSLYPRKVSKLDAEKAASKLKEEDWPLVFDGLKKYIKSWASEGKEKKFIPHPATFLNKRRFEDEIECDDEIQAESACHTFIKSVQNKNNSTMPILPNDIKQAIFRMGIPWGKLQQMSSVELEAKFEHAYNNMPSLTEVDFKSRAAGD